VKGGGGGFFLKFKSGPAITALTLGDIGIR